MTAKPELPRRPVAVTVASAALATGTHYLDFGGNPTVVAEGERLSVNPTGNPALATGGTGDVLSGAIAALLAAGLRPFDAARLGVFLHGLAGDLLAEEKGVGLLAREVAEALPRARRLLQEGRVPPAFFPR